MYLTCAHETAVPCVRILSNQSKQLGLQCQNCGDWQVATKEQRRQWITVGTYDPLLRDEWQRKQEEARNEYRVAEREAWFSQANEYYDSEEWALTRRAVLKRDEGLCQSRLPSCHTVASQVHHLTYAHFQNEPLFDLVAVCTSCHEQITTMDRERRVL